VNYIESYGLEIVRKIEYSRYSGDFFSIRSISNTYVEKLIITLSHNISRRPHAPCNAKVVYVFCFLKKCWYSIAIFGKPMKRRELIWSVIYTVKHFRFCFCDVLIVAWLAQLRNGGEYYWESCCFNL